MCHFAFSSTHLKYFILKEVSELFALPVVSSAFISGLIILGCDYKIMKQVKGGGSPKLLWGHFIIYMLHLLTRLCCFVHWFCIISASIYYMYIFLKKIYILGKNNDFLFRFLPLWKRKHIKTWWTRPEYNIMWLCNCFFLFSLCFFIRYK